MYGFCRYIFFDKVTPFDTAKELDNKNIAVGIVVGSIFISFMADCQ